jgi:hypothetical protein
MHGGKNWAAIALLVPGRTQKLCHYRWYDVLDPTLTGRLDVRINGQKTKTTKDAVKNARWETLGSNCRSCSWSNAQTV